MRFRYSFFRPLTCLSMWSLLPPNLPGGSASVTWALWTWPPCSPLALTSLCFIAAMMLTSIYFATSYRSPKSGSTHLQWLFQWHLRANDRLISTTVPTDATCGRKSQTPPLKLLTELSAHVAVDNCTAKLFRRLHLLLPQGPSSHDASHTLTLTSVRPCLPTCWTPSTPPTTRPSPLSRQCQFSPQLHHSLSNHKGVFPPKTSQPSVPTPIFPDTVNLLRPAPLAPGHSGTPLQSRALTNLPTCVHQSHIAQDFLQTRTTPHRLPHARHRRCSLRRRSCSSVLVQLTLLVLVWLTHCSQTSPTGGNHQPTVKPNAHQPTVTLVLRHLGETPTLPSKHLRHGSPPLCQQRWTGLMWTRCPLLCPHRLHAWATTKY